MRAPRCSPQAVGSVVLLLLLAAIAAAPAVPAAAPSMQEILPTPTPTPTPAATLTATSTPTPTPVGGGSGPSGPGSSSGEPHLRTPDGLGYDFQAAGEFVLVASTADDLAIQVRQEPWPSSTVVSMNTAVAANVAGDRVGLYVGEQPPLRVNGEPNAIADGASLPLPGGGRVEQQGAYYLIVWPDQTVVEVGLRSVYLDLVVRLAPARQGQVAGLLGNADGSTANDLATRRGTVIEVASLAAEAGRARLYDEFGNSWRISQAESLFDYGPGEDTLTYTRPDFPSALVTASDLPAMAQGMAEAVCRQAGVTAGTSLADCMLDVGLTGNAEFAASAAAVQAAIEPALGNAALVGGLYRGQLPGAMGVSPGSWFGALGGGVTAYELQEMSIEIQIDPTSQPAGDDLSEQLVTGGSLSYRAEVTYDTFVSGTWITEESFTGSAVEGVFYASPDATYGYIAFSGDETVRWLAGSSNPPETRSDEPESFAFVADPAGQLLLCPLAFSDSGEEPDIKATSQNCAATAFLTLQPVADEAPS